MLSRRHVVFTAAAGLAVAALPGALRAAGPAPVPTGWRRFRVTTHVDRAAAGPAQAWLPLAGVAEADWVRVLDNSWTAEGTDISRHSVGGADLLHARWSDEPRTLVVTSTVETRDRAADLSAAPRPGLVLAEAERARYLQGSALAPSDGLVKATADRITAGAADDRAKALAIYAWVADNTFRDGAVPGCGDGNVLRMLETGHLGGKCADINPLFVALVRAAGLPARDLYGIRVTPSRLGCASLGPRTGDVTKAQHCRAEVFLDGYGWVAMDPADVRKVMLEEVPGGLGPDDARVRAARTRLFGGWEGNWIPFNAANDLALPGSARPVDAFLMYPQFETAAGRLDCYRPQQVRYTVEAEEIAV